MIEITNMMYTLVTRVSTDETAWNKKNRNTTVFVKSRLNFKLTNTHYIIMFVLILNINSYKLKLNQLLLE